MMLLSNAGPACDAEVDQLNRLIAKVKYNHAVAQFERFKSLLTLPVEAIPCLVEPEEYDGEGFQFLYNGWFCEFNPAVESYNDVEIKLMTGRYNDPNCQFDGFGFANDGDDRTRFNPDCEQLQHIRATYGVELDFNNPDLTFVRYFEAWLMTMKIAQAAHARHNAELWDAAKERWTDTVKERFKTMKKNANKC
ncbi:MAG: hypothetical protein EBU46_11195 [Nitrosomonadaceae bacterium]|nr:hypothetical protein [Nitrosomonadaceae bacterium]